MASAPFNWDQCLQYAAVSDIGMRRAKNQDSHVELLVGDLESWHQRGHLFIVADGMGAHAAGELASKQAVDGIAHLYHKYQDSSPPEAILQAFRETNAEINRRGRANAEFYNMGTTCSALLLLPQGALVAHVGDSRVYRWRAQEIQQLTFDHSLVWEMRAAGQLAGDDDESTSFIPKNVITRSLGPQATVQVDLEGPYSIKEGDVFLLCSDGLTGKVKDAELGAILGGLPPREAGQMLVDLANLRGGPDNITAIVVQAVGPEITTQHANATPLIVGDEPTAKRAIHPAVWVALGVGFSATFAMLFVNQGILALVSLLVAVAASAVAILQKFGSAVGVSLAGSRRLGKGPYRKASCSPNKDFDTALRATIDDAWEQLDDEEPDVAANKNETLERASRLVISGDQRQALRCYSNLLRDLARAARAASRAGDSSVELR